MELATWESPSRTSKFSKGCDINLKTDCDWPELTAEDPLEKEFSCRMLKYSGLQDRSTRLLPAEEK